MYRKFRFGKYKKSYERMSQSSISQKRKREKLHHPPVINSNTMADNEQRSSTLKEQYPPKYIKNELKHSKMDLPLSAPRRKNDNHYPNNSNNHSNRHHYPNHHYQHQHYRIRHNQNNHHPYNPCQNNYHQNNYNQIRHHQNNHLNSRENNRINVNHCHLTETANKAMYTQSVFIQHQKDKKDKKVKKGKKNKAIIKTSCNPSISNSANENEGTIIRVQPLLILDLNGILCHRLRDAEDIDPNIYHISSKSKKTIPRESYRPIIGRVSHTSIIPRMDLHSFLHFLDTHFTLAIWSSAKERTVKALVEMLIPPEVCLF